MKNIPLLACNTRQWQKAEFLKPKTQSTRSANSKIPKSLSISQMIKLGKDVGPNEETSVFDIYSFDLENITWSLLPQKVEFRIEKDAFGSGGFREAFKARSSSIGFNSSMWVVKRYLDSTAKEVRDDIKLTVEEHTKKVIQMHALGKNFADQLNKKVLEHNVSEEFGETLKYQEVYFAKLDSECLTLEKFIEGKFEKYLNNTGELCVPDENVIGRKAQCLSYFSYEISNGQPMVLDLKGSGHILYDPEIASATIKRSCFVQEI